ncbi:hypothetical protein B6I21_09610 [candidate division KSB1 bacterium 4572_119]|nr:MAG: hypothetical protein B6I21_09610 [candidate division KSB1 bacterium 4572_119]
MPERLKDIFFTRDSLNKFGDIVKNHYPEFDKDKFLSLIFTSEWESKELKGKMRHTTICLRETLPPDLKQSLDILYKIAPLVKGFEAMSLPDYVELYGMNDWDLALPALGYFTQFISAEFAIRPFLDNDPEKVMTYMNQWAEDKHANVRRFASEGCRPRLPWAMALPKFKKNPKLIFPLLEKLKNDESEFVRRSVANNLNDISKDNPDLMLDICEKWYGSSKETDWIVKHACRSLLKAGNKRALILFGYSDPKNIKVRKLELENKNVTIGTYLHYSFDLHFTGNDKNKVRLEYGIDFMKANGKQSRKIFKITENTYEPGTISFSKKHSFADMSTRKHYAGEHKIAVIVNGEKKASEVFNVAK